ncbi:eukaryotic translation initiation factor 3 subunit J-like [Daphnia pulex]|uniref:eukaryotic translation initiation factor 3 subunit J-like n=1 Tax=Daphnia pulex TaxID=6669 RepID=UPI001EE0D4DD|nr:eukaryotic translation initiation factor 3 subunit J-like [Daphnia pulex]
MEAEADWDAEDFEPSVPVPVTTAIISDKWEGEDEDEPVKDSWEDEETENKPAEVKAAATATKKKSSKRLEEKIAEKEKKSREEAEARKILQEANMTPEERIAEKLRRQKLVEESDFEMAKETFGITGSLPTEGSIDEANPSSKEEFSEFKNNLVKKLQSLSTKACYNDFIEDFIKDVCIGLEVEVLRKVSLTTKSLHEEKLKMVKAATKGGKKGKTKVALKMDKGMVDNFGDDFGGGDYDDFM